MSKKMMKRSLALGALMAFVITGSAMAEELTIKYDEVNNAYVMNGINYDYDGMINKLREEQWYGYTVSSSKETINNSAIYSNNVIEITNLTSSNLEIYASGVSKDKNDDSKENTVNVIDSEVRNVYGAFVIGSGDATNNTVSVVGGKVNNKVNGGLTYQGDASNNYVTVENVTVVNNVQGGHAYSADNIAGGNANNNVVYVKGEKTSVGYEIMGGNSHIGNANENEVTVECVTEYNSGIYGGVARSDKSHADRNVVNVKDTTVSSGRGLIIGGYIAYGYTTNKESTMSVGENIVNIKNSDITKDVYGGKIVDVSNGSVINNVVNIENSKINGSVYGGHAYSNAQVSNNVVNILGKDTDISNANLYGGFVHRNNGTLSGNTLNINDGWTGNVKSIQNFNNINFAEVEWGAGNTVVNVSDKLVLNETEGTTVTVDTVRVSGAYEPETEMTLIAADSITGKIASDSSAKVFKGVATVYDASVVKDGNDIKIQLGGEDTATYNAGVMNPQVLVIGESRAAATAFTNQGSELIETGLDALARDKAEDTKAFAAVYGNTSEFATGSEVKVNGWSGIVGVGKTNANGLTVGAFFENGEGNYRTYNDVNGDFMRGDGDACYNGGGFIVRKDNANGVYTEASLRAGNLQNELRNAVQGSEGLAGYDIDTFYYGAHVGVGKVIARGNDGDSIDVYGKFIYTHHEGEDFTIDGDKFHFDSVDSERLRLGFRINEVQTNKLSMYYGAAWEYEFGGDSDNTVVGYDLSTPSLGGSTVIGELGMHYKASEKWSFDLNGRAYTGQRDGFSGSVQANYAF